MIRRRFVNGHAATITPVSTNTGIDDTETGSAAISSTSSEIMASRMLLFASFAIRAKFGAFASPLVSIAQMHSKALVSSLARP